MFTRSKTCGGDKNGDVVSLQVRPLRYNIQIQDARHKYEVDKIMLMVKPKSVEAWGLEMRVPDFGNDPDQETR